MIEQSQKTSTSESHQHDNLKIRHQNCSKNLNQDWIIQLIEQYLLVKSNIFKLSIDNINIDINIDVNLTKKKCCPDLKISSVLNKLKNYCLNCQKLISQFPQNQRKEYLNDKISFCLKCFLDIQRAKNIDQSKKTSRQLLLENIIMHCKKQQKTQEEKENQQHQQHQQQFLKAKTINEKEMMGCSHKNDKINDSETLLSKMTKPQLIEKISAMTLQLRDAHEQTKKYKDQSERNCKLILELQHQNKMLQNKPEFSFQQSHSITLLNTSNNSSCVQSSFCKNQSKMQSEICNINQNQNFSKQNSDDQNTRFHPQKIEQAQEMQFLNVVNLKDSSRSSIVPKQKNEDDTSNNEKPNTRSERNFNSTSVLNQNYHKNYLTMTTPLKGISKRQRQKSKDYAVIEPVNVPIMKKNVNNKNGINEKRQPKI